MMFLGGDFGMLSPASLIQTMGQEQRSVQIRAWRGDSMATVQLLEGMIVGATCDDLRGEEALFRFAVWDSGRFEVALLDDDAAPEMMASWEELLLEAARQRDELELALPTLPEDPTRDQLDRLHAECPELAGIALMSRDGRVLGARGMDDALVTQLPMLFFVLESLATMLQSEGISYVTAGRRRLLMVERGDHRMIGEPAPGSDLRAVAARMAALVGVPALRS